MPSVVSGLLLVDLLYCHHVDSALYYSIEKEHCKDLPYIVFSLIIALNFVNIYGLGD